MSRHNSTPSRAWKTDLENEPLLCQKPVGIHGKENTTRHLSTGFPLMLRGKKVLLMTESLGPINGVSRTTLMLLQYLRQHGVEVAVVAPQIKSSKSGIRSGPYVDVRLKGYSLPYNPDLTTVYPFTISRIFKRTFRPDLIYFASPASVGFQALMQIRQLTNGPPVICNFQTDLASYSDIILPKGMSKAAIWLLGIVQRHLFRSSSVHTVFYPSSGIGDYLENIGVQRSKLVHLGRGVDTRLFDSSCRDVDYRQQLAPNGEIILVTVSRLAPEKGFEFLSKAAMKLAEVGLPFRLVIVGGNRNPSVEAEVQELFTPIKDKVIFTGFLTGNDLARAYASADIFLHCSITETFGLVVLEAMASGLPVVARNQGGPSDIVRHEKTGYLTRPDDLGEFISRIQQLCEFSNIREAFAHMSRAVALETTWQKINERAAQQIAIAIEHQHLGRTTSAQHHNEARTQRWTRVSNLCRRVLEPGWTRLKMLYAMCVIWLVWSISVLPLIVHGHLVYKSR